MTDPTSPVDVVERLERLAELGCMSPSIPNATEIVRAAAALIRELTEALEKIANSPTGGVGCNPAQFVKIALNAMKGGV